MIPKPELYGEQIPNPNTTIWVSDQPAVNAQETDDTFFPRSSVVGKNDQMVGGEIHGDVHPMGSESRSKQSPTKETTARI